MVKKIEKGQTVYFECEKCGLRYRQKIWAERCQEWCSKNKSCNLEIAKQANKTLPEDG